MCDVGHSNLVGDEQSLGTIKEVPMKSSPPVETVIDALAVARLTRLFQEDDVWPVLEIRKAYLAEAGDSRWADLVECPFCLGIWIAAGVVAARYLWPRGWPIVARILAGSAVAGHLGQLG